MSAILAGRIYSPPDSFTDAVDTRQQQTAATRKDENNDGSLSFGDIIDAINPLQHIPIISSIYRAITGDEISAPARIAGGALYGGPIGLVGGIANSILELETGRDVGAHMVAAVTEEPAQPAAEIASTAESEAEIAIAENAEEIETYADYDNTVDKAPLIRVSATQLPEPNIEYQWEEVSATLPAGAVDKAAPSATEHLPWTADMPTTPTVLDADNSLAPLPWIATIGSGLPPALPGQQVNANRSYAPYPALPASYARQSVDLSA